MFLAMVFEKVEDCVQNFMTSKLTCDKLNRELQHLVTDMKSGKELLVAFSTKSRIDYYKQFSYS